MISRLERLGINPKQVSGSGVSRLSQIESDGSLTEAQKDAKTKEVASKNQEDTEGSKARGAVEATAKRRHVFKRGRPQAEPAQRRRRLPDVRQADGRASTPLQR